MNRTLYNQDKSSSEERMVMKRRTFISDSAKNVRINTTLNSSPKHIHTFEQAVKVFLEDNRRRGLSEHTNTFYTDQFQIWTNFYSRVKNQTPPLKLNLSDLEAFIDYRINVHKVKRNGVIVTLRALKRYSNFLRQIGVTQSSIFDTFTMPRDEDVIILTFTEIEINKLLEVCNTRTFVGYRDYVLFLFLLDTGVRLRELTDVRVSDVSFEDSSVQIFGKNQRYRRVPMSKTLSTALKKYLDVRGDSVSDRLFISNDDTGLTKRAIQERVSIMGKKAGIASKRCSPHTFRHTFAKMYIINGGSPLVLMDILGHSTYEMVKRYVRLYSHEMNTDHARNSPLNRLI